MKVEYLGCNEIGDIELSDDYSLSESISHSGVNITDRFIKIYKGGEYVKTVRVNSRQIGPREFSDRYYISDDVGGWISVSKDYELGMD